MPRRLGTGCPNPVERPPRWVAIRLPRRRGDPPSNGAAQSSYIKNRPRASSGGVGVPGAKRDIRNSVRSGEMSSTQASFRGTAKGTGSPPFSEISEGPAPPWSSNDARLKNSRAPSVSMGGPFARPALVIWTMLVIRGGGGGRLSQAYADPKVTTDAANAAHLRLGRCGGAATRGKDGDDGC